MAGWKGLVESAVGKEKIPRDEHGIFSSGGLFLEHPLIDGSIPVHQFFHLEPERDFTFSGLGFV